MAIRSGRFKVVDPSNVDIISGRSGTYFRFFNSGDNTFTVKVDGPLSAPDRKVDLKPTFTVDMVIAGDVRISGTGPVEGIYDYLESPNEVRSGRFNIKLTDPLGNPHDPTDRHPIILLAGGNQSAYYRIFNSGDHPIVLQSGLQANPIDIKALDPDQSFDFEVGTGRRIVTVKSTDVSKPIEGIYEFLGT